MRLLATVEKKDNEKLSKMKSEKCAFLCIWNETVDIEKEIGEAQNHCKAYKVLYHHPPDENLAVIFGQSTDEEMCKAQVECVHSYFLNHGWKHAKKEA